MTGPVSAAAETSAAEARDVRDTAAQAGAQVAGSAGEQASQVAEEVRRQAGDLVGAVRSQITEQARAGQQRAGDGLRALATELQHMSGGDHAGPVSDLAAQAGGKLDELAGWLDQHEPGDLVAEVRSFARRRPGIFLGGAAAAGLLLGRLTRGVVDGSGQPAAADAPPATPPASAAPQTAPPPVPPPDRPLVGTTAPPPPAVPPVPPGTAPAHGVTTVGEYVEQLERGTPPAWSDPQEDTGERAR